jgi:uncharacterized protein YdeI (YjbR/CyaY-like superfamily)
MGQRDPRIDAYIAAAAPWAQPLLTVIRDAVHAGCPDVEETIKWRAPTYMHGGRILARMAAFQAHCGFGFWHGNAAADPWRSGEAMGQFGRLAQRADLPSARELEALVRAAVARMDSGVARVPRQPRQPPRPLPAVPADLAAALAAQPAAQALWNALAPGHRREYLEWVIEAKRDATRAQRIGRAVAAMAEGRKRYWDAVPAHAAQELG